MHVIIVMLSLLGCLTTEGPYMSKQNLLFQKVLKYGSQSSCQRIRSGKIVCGTMIVVLLIFACNIYANHIKPNFLMPPLILIVLTTI